MVKFDVVTLLVRALYAQCKVGVPLSVQGLGETKQNFCSVGHTEPKARESPLQDALTHRNPQKFTFTQHIPPTLLQIGGKW